MEVTRGIAGSNGYDAQELGGRVLPEGQIDPCRKLLETEWFHHIVHRTPSEAAEYITLMALGSHHNHRHRSQPRIALKPPQHLESTQARHHGIQQDQVRQLTRRQEHA